MLVPAAFLPAAAASAQATPPVLSRTITAHLHWLDEKLAEANKTGMISRTGFDDGHRRNETASWLRTRLERQLQQLGRIERNGQRYQVTSGPSCESKTFEHITATICTAKGAFADPPQQAAEAKPKGEAKCAGDDPCSMQR